MADGDGHVHLRLPRRHQRAGERHRHARQSDSAPDDRLPASAAANFSAPTFFAQEGQALYLTLTNSGMRERPDLFDPHTVHFHGFPNAALGVRRRADGVTSASASARASPTSTTTNFAGTYMWHCHVEAAEHMQMGMLGNLYILPAQDGTARQRTGGSGPAYCFKDADADAQVDRLRLQRRRRLDRLRRRCTSCRRRRSTRSSTTPIRRTRSSRSPT